MPATTPLLSPWLTAGDKLNNPMNILLDSIYNTMYYVHNVLDDVYNMEFKFLGPTYFILVCYYDEDKKKTFFDLYGNIYSLSILIKCRIFLRKCCNKSYSSLASGVVVHEIIVTMSPTGIMRRSAPLYILSLLCLL